MASLPPQTPQRRSSPTEQSSSAATSDHEVAQPEGQSNSANKDSSQSVMPNQSDTVHSEDSTTTQSTANTAAAAREPEPRHCWICLQDEGDEGSDNWTWRSPCPCNMQAHEDCMLEWIADLEAPYTRKGRPPGKILCPQCKAEIQVERPRDVVVSAMDLLNSIGRVLILPAGLAAFLGCLFSGSFVYGANSVFLVCGSDYGWKLFSTSREYTSTLQMLLGDRLHRAMMKTLKITDPFMPISGPTNLTTFFLLPMIAPALILSRTSLADHAFAVLPISYFALSQNHSLRHWPPSPTLAFAVLPYLRSAYNEFYRISFAKLEKQWDQAILRKPREGETANEVAQGMEERGGEGGVLELQIGIEFRNLGEQPVFRDQAQQAGEREQPAAPHPDEVDPIHPMPQRMYPPADGEAGEQPVPNAPQVDGDVDPQPDHQQPNGQLPAQRDDELEAGGNHASASDIASTVMGALFFPAVSSLMGDLLKVSLPRKWVVKPSTSATGLLQEKWGRSIVGGCLFVVLKDVLNLYVKWKRARDQGKRRILDYNASQRKLSDVTSRH